MYVVWKRRPLTGTRRCEVCGDMDADRISLVPHLVASRRVGGAPRQIHLARLPSVRSCCLRHARARDGWWRRVEATLGGLRDETGERLRESDLEQIRRKLRAGLDPGRHRHRGRAHASPGAPRHLAHALGLLRLGWPCTQGEAKAAFRARAKETHPDVGGSAEEFRTVAEAYAHVSSSL